jgi:Uma2 family endonuclease
MATDTRKTIKKRRDPWRSIYRFSAEQALAMVEHGILPEGARIELWDGIFYQLTKGELHNAITTAIANALRLAAPVGYHVREEKSCSYGEHSLPEPDVAVCRGGIWSYGTKPPQLARLALVVEVDHTTKDQQADVRHHRFAEVGIPVYWQIGVQAQMVSVFTLPGGSNKSARYADVKYYQLDDTIPIVVDGLHGGQANVADFCPPEDAEAQPLA